MTMLACNLELQPFDLGFHPTRLLIFIQFVAAICSFADSLLPECQQNCAEINVPYPFEITPGCGLPAFTLNCTSGSSPSLSIASTAIQILNISSKALIVDASSLVASSCVTPSNTTHHPHLFLGDSSPFVFSSNNQFFVTGCNVSGSFSTDVPAAIATCQTNCSTNQPTTYPFCDLPGCCFLSLPTGSRSLSMEAQSLAINRSECGYARALYPSLSHSPDEAKSAKNGSFGIQLLWAIPSRSCENAIDGEGYACSSNASCVYVPEAPGYICECSRHGYAGDGYMNGSGCFDVDECAELTSNQCSPAADCINTLGSYGCHCLESFYGDGYVNGTGCVSRRGIFSEAILIGCLSGVAFMTSIIAFVFWRCKVKPLGSK